MRTPEGRGSAVHGPLRWIASHVKARYDHDRSGPSDVEEPVWEPAKEYSLHVPVDDAIRQRALDEAGDGVVDRSEELDS